MMSNRFASLLFVLAISSQLFGQSPPASPPQLTGTQEEKPPDTCTISGHVFSASDGAPIRSARITLLQESSQKHPPSFSAATDSEGHFLIAKVPVGRYHFFASRAGFIGQQYQARGASKGAILSLSAGDDIKDAVFRLVRAAAINGRVLDEAGEPVAHVAISAMRRPTEEERENMGKAAKKRQFVDSSWAQTDDRGEYRLFGLKPGEYYLKAAESPSFDQMEGIGGTDYLEFRELTTEYAPLYYPGVIQIEEAQSISLRGGEEAQADFTLRHVKTVDISGRVVGADGKPATHAYLMLSVPNVSQNDMSAQTDSKGEFTIRKVPPGSYVLIAAQMDDNKQKSARQKLEVGDSNVESIVLAFGGGVNIPGRVTSESPGTAFDRIILYLQSQDADEGPIPSFSQVKSDGSFQLADVADGGYIVNVDRLEKGWFVKAIHFGSADVLQNGLQIERGSTAGNLELLISSASAQLDGVVNDQDGKPLVAAQVRVRPDPETDFNRSRSDSTGTDQNGRFSFPSLATGKYKVTARLPGATPDVPALNSEAQSVTLKERDHQSLQFEITLSKEDQ